MEPFFAEVDEIEGVKVVSPYSPEGERVQQRAEADLVRPAVLHRARSGGHAQLGQGDPGSRRQGGPPTGLRIEYGGQVFAGFELPASEILGILAAVIILLIAFGSVMAMGLPIGTALFGLGVGDGDRGHRLARAPRCPSSPRRWPP